MHNFWLLLFVHIVADFPLQTDYVFLLKQNKKWGILLHGAIHFGLSAIVLFPYWKSLSLWMSLFFLAVLHILIDKSKLRLGFSRSVMSFLFFGIDQLIHILIIAFVAFFLLQNIEAAIFFPFYRYFFFNTRLLIVLCAFFFVVFGSTFFVYYGRLVWESLKPSGGKLIGFPAFRFRLLGYIERLFSILLIFAGTQFAWFIPGIYLPRFVVCWNKSADHRYIITNFFISILFIVAFYFLFYGY